MQKPKLLDRVRAFARVRHLSLRTEQAYSDWIRRFILFHRKRHPEEMGAEEIRLYISHLAVEGRVSASTQNVALCALLFLYRDVLGMELSYVEGIRRAKRPTRLPVVFTRREVEKLPAQLSGSYGLITTFALRFGAEADGGGAATCQGRGFRVHGNPRARRQGGERPEGYPAASALGAAAPSS